MVKSYGEKQNRRLAALLSQIVFFHDGREEVGIVVDTHKLFYGIVAAVEEAADAMLEHPVKGVARELFYDPERVVRHRVPAGKIFPLKEMMDDLQLPERNGRKIYARIIRYGSLKFDQLRDLFRRLVMGNVFYMLIVHFGIRQKSKNVQNRHCRRQTFCKFDRASDLFFRFIGEADNKRRLNGDSELSAVIDRRLCKIDIDSFFDLFNHLGIAALKPEKDPSAAGLIHKINVLFLENADPHLAAPDKIQPAVNDHLKELVSDGPVRQELLIRKIDPVRAAFSDKILEVVHHMLRFAAAVFPLVELFVRAKGARCRASF